ncbi:DNA-3-methyladenine glycosylase I [Conexibacter woesei]|uniref:DNA-3-methyladenine glycosylase I n=1 Tax=Conexibacter woesei TaxID=191495 RepID=UPI00041D50FC|nr:DNA-3-methyladenine glycosylase I [Conexibacter woesei]
MTAAELRCFGADDPLYRQYHDEEWGRPVRDEVALYERISLEAFQSGLAWITILRKRDNFRAAFEGFDPVKVARYGADDFERLMADAGIVRNRLKIEATIANARALLDLREAGESLVDVVWAHAPDPGRPAPAGWGDVPAVTPESKALAKTLKQKGFRFVGPTTAYAAMQACGLVNDHLAGCVARAVTEAAQTAIRHEEV